MHGLAYRFARSLAAVLAVTLLASSCGEDSLPGIQDVAPVSARLSVGGAATRVSGDAGSGEGSVARWAVFVFDRSASGALVTAGTSTSDGPITVSVAPGVEYDIAAVANYPQSFDPASVTSLGGLRGTASALRDNSAGSLVMYGSARAAFTASSPAREIAVDRLACKIGLRTVTLSMTDPYHASLPFRLTAVFPSNVYLPGSLGADHTAAEALASGGSSWMNRMGVAGSGGLRDEVDAPLGQGGSYTTPHYFYVYPNAIPSGSDTRAEPWSPRCTRLVLEARVGDMTRYYAVTIPAMERNHSYVINTLTVKGLGSPTPEGADDGSVDVVFDTETGDWDGPVTVSESDAG